ncbi:protocadherin Fat 1-like isoform X2 [Pecten maximus]|uniref:protocadherin Fat 1-like isoform X2 n=1 Tax=Pecten maximus TaxID=6579 RepID=UPI00145847DB|nr:protocadherin Fat 1-like isoform X2 [Pecten maximus]
MGIPDQCVDPNADCSVSGGVVWCACKKDFYRNPTGSCTPQLALGASCASGLVNQCADENSKCGDSKTCTCNPGFYKSGSVCAAELGLGAPCDIVDGGCGVADSECKDSVCACKTNFYDDNGAEVNGTCAPKSSEPVLKTYDCSLTLNQVFIIEMNDLNSEIAQQIARDLATILRSELGNTLLAVVLIRLWPGSVNIDYQATLSNPVTPQRLQEAVVNGQKAEINNLAFITSIDPNSINVNESVPTPCISTPTNRTAILLNGRCGNHSETGFCVTPNSACVERLGIWSCRCESSFIQTKDQRSCTPAPRYLFAYHNLTVTLQVPKPVGTEIVTIPFSNEVSNLCATTPEVSFTRAFTDNNFRYEVNCTAITVILDSSLSSTDASFALGIQTKMSFSDLVVADEMMTILETLSNVSIPTELCLTVVDGAFSGQLLVKLPSLRTGDSYSAAVSSRYRLHGESVYSISAINLTAITGKPDIVAYMDKFVVTYGSKSLTVKFLIVRVEMDLTKKEDTSTNSVILEYSISDDFTLASTDIPSTNLTLGTSDVRVGPGRLDFESGMSPIIFNIRVSVCTLTASTKVILHLTDANDNSPQFSSDSYSFDIFPTSLAGLLVGVVTVTDVDTMTTLTFNVDSPNFSIDNQGVIKTLDRTELIPFIEITGESKYAKNVHINVTVSDGVRSSKADIFVNLARQPGTNLGKTFSANILENSPAGTDVALANVSGYIDFEFASSRAEQYFFINSTTGEVFTKKELDRENEDEKELHFAITAFKSSETTCSLTVLGDLEVIVDDVNDNAPVFERSAYTGKIQEGGTIGRTVELDNAISATDADDNPTFTFAITGSSFAIDDQTGVITTTTEIDREKTEFIIITVTADDGVNTGSASINITVIDINDNPPTFTAGDWRSSSVSEGASVGDVVTTVTANDLDSGENGRVFYSIQGDSGYFRIDDRLSGKITIAHALDRETKPVHSLIVLARDNGSPLLSVNTTVSVSLIDVNDNDPVFDEGSLIVAIMEDACTPTGVSLFTVSTTDEDEGLNGEIASYSITGGNEDEIFTINNDGVVRCDKGLDYETTTEYKLVTVATDNGTPQKSSSSTLTLSINDVNDNSPSFTQELSTGSHFIKIRKSDFDGGAGKPVMVVTVVDEDSGQNGQINRPITLTLSPGLSLSLSESGVLRTETSNPPIQNLTAEFTATDKGNPPLTATATLTLEIVDDGTLQGKVQFKSQDIPMSIEENVANKNIGTLSNEVTSQAGSAVVFDKVSGAENVKIDSSGNVMVEDSFDREWIQSTVIVVRATVEDESDLALVTVRVIDVNDNPPTFGSTDKYRLLLSEDKPTNTEIETLTATDQDEGLNQKITYTIVETDGCSSHFTVNSISEILLLDKNLDREESFSFCAFSIKAADGGSPILSAVIPVEVIVLDVNDNKPLFRDLSSAGKYEITAKEDLRISDQTDPFGYITDDDVGENGDVYVTIEPGTVCPFTARIEISTADVFKIIFTLASELDFETVTFHTCFVLVFDKGTPTLNNTVEVKVTVTDVNDNAPVFSKKEYNASVSRDANIDHVIIDEINATDAESTNLRFKFDDEDSDKYFTIDFTTARITVRKKLVDLQKDDLILNVKVTDEGIPPLSNKATVSLKIIDDNIRPEFDNSLATLQLVEHASVTNPIFTAVATDRIGRQDPETCDCTYRFTTPSDIFEINNNTGKVSVKPGIDIDRERAPEVTLYVIATDPGNKDSLPLSLVITVLDINDQSPVFTDIRDGDYRFVLSQAAPSGSFVGRVIAEDADAGENAVPVYSLRSARYSWSPLMVDTTDLFQEIPVSISAQNGTITTNASIDLNATRNFFMELIVKAEDSKDSLKITETKVIVQVNYLDPNRHHPMCSQGLYRTSLAKTTKIGTILDINVNATDLDTGPDGRIDYKITAGNVRDIFSIDSGTGQLSVAFVIDVSTDMVNLTIQVEDEGNIPKTGNCFVEIYLTGEPIDCKYSLTSSPQSTDQWFIPMVVLAAVLGVSFVAILVLVFKFCQLRNNYQNPNDFASRGRRQSVYTHLGRSKQEPYSPFSASTQSFPGHMVPSGTNGGSVNGFDPYRRYSHAESSNTSDYDPPNAPPAPILPSRDSRSNNPYSSSVPRPTAISFREPDSTSFRNSTFHEPDADYD